MKVVKKGIVIFAPEEIIITDFHFDCEGGSLDFIEFTEGRMVAEAHTVYVSEESHLPDDN